MNARDSRGRLLARALPVLRLAAAIGAVTAVSAACGGGSTSSELDAALLAQGQKILRFDAFGDESQWTTKPAGVVQSIKDGSVDLTLPATSVTLLKPNAVVSLQRTDLTH